MMSKAAEIDIVSVSKIYGSTTAVHSIAASLGRPAAAKPRRSE
jgi:putative spermidine/putrescine transport system ATP-binding protein